MTLRERLALAEKQIQNLGYSVDASIDEARGLLDKYEDKQKLNTARIKLLSERIDDQVTKIKQLADQVEQIKADLEGQ